MIFTFIYIVTIGSVIANDPPADGWKQITFSPVCVNARDNGYGRLQYIGKGQLVAALKLKHQRGKIRCATDEAYNSNWGCDKDNGFNIIVTDRSNHVIYPLKEFIKESSGMWYYIPLADAVHSTEIVFTDFSHPFYLKQGGELRFWYGEDLKKHHHTDNQGQVCFDVLALYV
ncbi:uncharacterized protein LOC111331107 [Stylophora pistillata]|uniref:Uncharacterized protein n=1 Tax=Stylophora pistillata TaxID=50429 RepID=A0A2B4S8A6_STYPI|nr:uncharacterized protein LOC111331107 [Stylophora pistillata]PFX24808.1 hypothetical protein AWC38_SpisGene10572 [Stylophora pistillata]